MARTKNIIKKDKKWVYGTKNNKKDKINAMKIIRSIRQGPLNQLSHKYNLIFFLFYFFFLNAPFNSPKRSVRSLYIISS